MITPIKYIVYRVLPLVYDDSLSYLEILAKVTAKTNEVIEQINTISGHMEDMDSYIRETAEQIVTETVTPEYVRSIITETYLNEWLADSAIIDVLENDISTINGTIDTLTQDNTDTKNRVTDLEGDNTTNKNRIGSLETDNATNKNNIETLQSKTANLENLYKHYIPIENLYGDETSALDNTIIEGFMEDNPDVCVIFGAKTYSFNRELNVKTSIECSSGQAEIIPGINCNFTDSVIIRYIKSTLVNVNMNRRAMFYGCELTLDHTLTAFNYAKYVFHECIIRGFINVSGAGGAEVFNSTIYGDGDHYMFSITGDAGIMQNTFLSGQTNDGGIYVSNGVVIATSNRIRIRTGSSRSFTGGDVTSPLFVYANNVEQQN